MPEALRMERVTYRYPADTRAALDDVSLSLARTER